MNFEKAKKITTALFVGSLFACVVSLFFADSNPQYTLYAFCIAIAMLVMGIIVAATFCKCPYCGKRILLGMLKVTHCPSCRRDLVTGVRKKGKGGKKIKH